ncbi:MAG TPA: substrate-binding domain-containing protein [Candidatus Binatia bacterium]|nr:substrate-binding domain-containing protein [Candidatus Binatia bacterium]
MATHVKVLSAGAVQHGLSKLAEAFRLDGESTVEIEFATAPAIAKRIAAGYPTDIIVAPPDLLQTSTTTGLMASRTVPLGRIGVGVMVRAGAPLPPIANAAEFEHSVQIAERIIYNQASTGIYLDSLFQRLGIAATLEVKTVRYSDFAAVRRHIANGHGNEIGFGATTVIVEGADKGVTFVGPLPAEIQHYTAYAAALISNGGEGSAAAFLEYLATPAAKSILRSAGIE